MKEYFLFYGAAALLGTVVVYFLWSLAKALVTIYQDWRLGRELAELESQREQREAQRLEAVRQRLDNGCDHEFDDAYGAFPPDVCRKCGIAKRRPPSYCDHVWRRLAAPDFGSRCDQCGQEYRPLPTPSQKPKVRI